jgi:hypothetical protein
MYTVSPSFWMIGLSKTLLPFSLRSLLKPSILGQFFMEPSDYYDAPIYKVLHFIRRVGLIKRNILWRVAWKPGYWSPDCSLDNALAKRLPHNKQWERCMTTTEL